MSKEIYISTTPHETRLAIVEDEQLSEIYFERENEYTLAGSIYNGKVTRVLPGMQSSFVDVGLERDAFLYVTDFMEEAGDSADFEGESGGRAARAPREGSLPSGSGDRDSRRGSGRRDRGPRHEARPASEESTETISFGEPVAPHPTEGVGADSTGDGSGSRRWRGRRGRRRGRDGAEGAPADTTGAAVPTDVDSQDDSFEEVRPIEIDLSAEADAGSAPFQPSEGRDRDRNRGRGRGGRDRNRGSDRNDRDRTPPAPREDAPTYSADDASDTSAVEPMVLPGESIRKYRSPEELAAEEPTRSAANTALPAASAPSIEIVGWDGGAVLPGETLSRRRGNDRQGSNRDDANRNDRGRQGRQREELHSAQNDRHVAQTPASEQAIASVSDEAPLAPTAVAEAPIPAAESAAESEFAQGETTVEEAGTAEVAQTPVPAEKPKAVEPAGEFEPTEGASAAAPAPEGARRNFFRRFLKPDAPVEPKKPEPVEPNFTAIQSSGEMLSTASEPTVEEHGFTPMASQDALAAGENPINRDALQTVVLTDAETTPVPQAEVLPSVHAFGHGDLEEEEMDGDDDTDFEALGAHGEDAEGEEYEEETLEGSADLAHLLSDISIDGHTAADEDEDGDEEPAEDEEEFTSGGEEEEEPAQAPAAAPGRSREARRPRGGGSRDRRGMRNSGERSHGGGGGRRQSMQTADLPAINDLLKPGQEILVQIAKEPIAKKGARITSHIALPGRFLVFMPTVNHTGVSRKISSDEERRRLKSILLSEKGDATGGFIVRTAADGASEEELRNDLRFLIHLWNDIKMRSESSKSPALIYHDLNLVERILRDQVTDNFSAIWVDTEPEYERVLRFLQRFQPSLVRRVKLYSKETPLFEHFGVDAEINKALKSKVWLKSGGSIVINQTEALVAIDINTGKFVGKTARLEDTIVKTNLDAIPEIVRQIRLRDLGGIIVIDFIDMDDRKNRSKVLQALEDAMRTDRAPSKILPFNDFGLVIMTRKRVKQSLERTLCMPDPVTEGTGMIKSPVTISNEIYIEMRKMYRHIEKPDVMLRVHPEVVKQLKANGGKRLQELEDLTKKTILVKSDPALSPEQFDIH